MQHIFERLAQLGTAVPELVLPAPAVNLEQWAVIACDQYTQDRDYWAQVKQQAGTSPSTLNLIFPEIFLADNGRNERIENIHQSMKKYLAKNVFSPPRQGFMYIERNTPFHPCRKGLLLAVDLEQYDWAPSARPLIRATEGTVPERIPPRMEIRRGAPLESPHILLLIDDEQFGLLEKLGDRVKKTEPTYATSLMLDSGNIQGWFLDEKNWQLVAEGLEHLAERAKTRYGQTDKTPFLYAVGDGNHSLATAKAVWEEYKAAHQGEPGIENHPARWALVEVENLYDPGISFEPIHRVVFGTDSDSILKALAVLPGFNYRFVKNREELSRLVGDRAAPKNRYGIIDESRLILAESDAQGIATDALQPLLDAFIKQKTGRSIDYIHGEDELFRLTGFLTGKSDNNKAEETENAAAKTVTGTGILLPPIKKEDLFKTVAASGPLPRKSFSMGEACEKRFYLECRKLFG